MATEVTTYRREHRENITTSTSDTSSLNMDELSQRDFLKLANRTSRESSPEPLYPSEDPDAEERGDSFEKQHAHINASLNAGDNAITGSSPQPWLGQHFTILNCSIFCRKRTRGNTCYFYISHSNRY
jgi:hypothetical protein